MVLNFKHLELFTKMRRRHWSLEFSKSQSDVWWKVDVNCWNVYYW